ncbi:MAG: sugar-binding protein [Planctomycetota bacterium]
MPQRDRTTRLRRSLGASARPTPASLVRASHLFESLEERRLLAADPLTPDHPLWAIPTGTAAIDGSLDDSDWSGALEIYRTQATRSDNAVWVRAMYNAAGLFLSVEARDANLWADGNGGGAGDIFEVEQDDSVVFYFDPDNSRDNIIQDSDRVFGVNLGDMNAPVNTNNGAVQRVKHVKGANSLVAAPRVAPGVDIPGGLVYATSYEGTLNNSSDTDIGWVVEVFMPWDTLNMAGPPAHGDTIGMNFEVIFDNNGGGRDFFDLRNGPDRFDFPHFIDDTLVGAHSSFSFGSGGVNGPVNYAEAMFINNTEVSRPRGVNDLAVGNSSPFGAQLTFTTPAGTSRGAGHVTSYDIRYSTTNITSEQDWANATRFENIYTPRLSGLSESLRIAGFQPASPYFISVRAVDASGNVGPLTPAVKVETRPDDGTQGRIIPAPNGYGLMFEDGTPFVPVGDHLGKPWAYTRTLFPGDIWDPANGVYQNFFENGAIEGDAETYFQTLQDQGVNTMRLYLEFQGSFVEGNPDPIPNGTYWLENNRGQFNPDMREFLHNVMDLAAQHDIYLILSPFNPFDYDDVFGSEGPWATNFGGPLTSINDFFQTNETLEMAQLRMTTIADWVGQNSNDHIVLGYETISEWDARWTVNDDQSASEMRQRAVWMQSLAAHIRDYDPDRLVLNSTVQRDPRGP